MFLLFQRTFKSLSKHFLIKHRYALICRMGIGLVFNLYDNKSSSKTKTSSSQNRTSLMDLKDTDLKRFCKSTVMICGLSDPLLFGNRNANKRLKKLGHDSELLILPGSHGFHGFPPLWMHYLGSNWRQNALPATIRLAKHFTNDLFQENLMLKMLSVKTCFYFLVCFSYQLWKSLKYEFYKTCSV